MQIKTLTADQYDRWDAFVSACEEATFFHRAGWQQVIEKGTGHKTHFLYAEDEQGIQGVLPLGHVKSLLFGNNLVSAPFSVYGGVAANSDEARAALMQHAVNMAESLGVDSLEMRHQKPVNSNWPTKDLYVTFRKEIDPDPEVNMMAIPRKQRAMVRKGIKAGLVGVEDEGIDRFFDAYGASVRNLGTPIFPKKYFQLLKDIFKDDCRILCIEHEGQVVSAVMSFYFRDQVLPYYGGGPVAARSLKANDFMYWDLMRRSAEEGIRIFDYGRSKQGTGSYSFKKNWGFEPEPLYYEFHLVKATELPDINPLNPKYQLFIKAWQKLPLRLSQWIGPYLARNLG